MLDVGTRLLNGYPGTRKKYFEVVMSTGQYPGIFFPESKVTLLPRALGG